MRLVAILVLCLLSVGCAARRAPRAPVAPSRLDRPTFILDLLNFNDSYATFSRQFFGCPGWAKEFSECKPGAGVTDAKVYRELTDLVTKVFPVRKEKAK